MNVGEQLMRRNPIGIVDLKPFERCDRVGKAALFSRSYRLLQLRLQLAAHRCFAQTRPRRGRRSPTRSDGEPLHARHAAVHRMWAAIRQLAKLTCWTAIIRVGRVSRGTGLSWRTANERW